MRINIGGAKGRGSINPKKDFKTVDLWKGSDYVVDLAFMDLPFETGAIDAVYTSHTMEHILPEKVDHVFKEVLRVLAPEGKFRVVVPDIDMAIRAYVENPEWLENKQHPGKLGVLPDMPITRLSGWFFTYYSKATKTNCKEDVIFGGHLMAYNWELLSYMLKAAGFSSVERMQYGKLSSEFEGCDMERYKNNSLYVEATK